MGSVRLPLPGRMHTHATRFLFCPSFLVDHPLSQYL